MAEISHLENREVAISQRKNHPILMKFDTKMDLEPGDSHVTKYENFYNSQWRTAAI